MKGDRNVIWMFLAFTVAMQWAGPIQAESASLEPAKVAASGVATPPARTGWKLPDSLSDWKLPETVQIHGFASQSYIHTDGNNFFGHSQDNGSLDFTEMGINGSWRPFSQLQASMQVVYRRAGKTDDSLVRIDFGFLDYSFISSADNLLGIRVGRVVNPYGLYNDTRDMPFTRPSILLPQSIYFDRNRQLALSGDGVQLYGEYHFGNSAIFLQTNAFYSRANDPSFKYGFARDLPGNMEGRLSWVGRLMYEWDAGRVRIGVSSTELNAKYEPAGGPVNLAAGNFTFSPILVSVQYNAEHWSLTGEYALRPTDLKGFGRLLPDTTFTGDSYYVQGSYRFSETVEGFLRYDAYYVDQTDRNGHDYAATTHQPAYSRFAKDLTTGLRWDLTPSIMLRAEYHYINGTGWISGLENPDPKKAAKYWNLFAVSVNFRF